MTLYLVRHAHAGDRSSHDGHDSLRPLSAKGRDQAAALVDALAGRPLERVLSSPALRCLQTVGPLATSRGLAVEPTLALAEGLVPLGAAELLDRLAAEGTAAVLCSHGDVIWWLIRSLELAGAEVDGDGGCRKASVWELEVHRGRIRLGRYHPAPVPLPTR